MTVSELIQRVEAASGPDMGIDYGVERLFRPDSSFTCPYYTTSVDAVIVLIGEKTNWQWELFGGGTDGAHARIQAGHGNIWIELAAVDAPTPALALLLAFLRAWEAKGNA